MDRIRIVGGNPLKGRITVGGSKNAALTLMPAALLTADPLVLHNIPCLLDITTMSHLLMQHGVSFSLDGTHYSPQGFGRTILLQANNITNFTSPYEIVRKMRASVLVLGPLLARFGEAKVSLPGGCAIGTRPIDLHLLALEAMGAVVSLEEGYIYATAPKGLKGAEVHFPQRSVGATENALMAATLAHGTTRLHNAAKEPEIVDLAECLQKMGANIEGAGTDVITIIGATSLHGAHHRVMADRIEAGSYAVAAGISGGDVELLGVNHAHIQNIIAKIVDTGISMEPTLEGVRVRRQDDYIRPVDISTSAYPGFPTDMQAQFMTLMSVASGECNIAETIFENRFMHVPELCRMGADIQVKGNTATVSGVKNLKGAQVMATDLRASVSLVLAGLVAQGETIVNRIYHLDRGYERIEDKLFLCGAEIERLR